MFFLNIDLLFDLKLKILDIKSACHERYSPFFYKIHRQLRANKFI